MKSVDFSGRKLSWLWRSEAEALAEQAAGAQRDLRLDDVIAGPRLVRLRVEEGQQPGLLVRLEHEREQHRQGGPHRHQSGGDEPQAQTAQDHHQPARGHDQHGGPEVRLARHQGGGNQDQAGGDQQAPGELRPVLRQPVVEAGQGEHEGDLDDLRRLKPDRTEIQPPLRAQAGVADHRHRQQQQHAEPVDRIGRGVPDLRVDQRERDHHPEAHRVEDQVARGPGRPRASGDRIEHQPPAATIPVSRRHSVQSIWPSRARKLSPAGGAAEVERGHAVGSSMGRSEPLLAGEWPPMPSGMVTIRARTSGSFSRATRSSSAALGAAASAPKPPCSTRTLMA